MLGSLTEWSRLASFGTSRYIISANLLIGRIKINLFWTFIYNVIGIPIAAGMFVWAGLTLSPELAGLAMAFSGD